MKQTPPDPDVNISTPQAVLDFWFHPTHRSLWFRQSARLDRDIAATFGPTYAAARAGALTSWQQTARGALALAIVLDQFPRNMFRGTARAFETGDAALILARAAIDAGYDLTVAPDERGFFYLPFMHSESLADQDRCVGLYSERGTANGLRAAQQHRDIIARFGRFPHRNAALGRQATPEEQAFLQIHAGW